MTRARAGRVLILAGGDGGCGGSRGGRRERPFDFFRKEDSSRGYPLVESLAVSLRGGVSRAMDIATCRSQDRVHGRGGREDW